MGPDEIEVIYKCMGDPFSGKLNPFCRDCIPAVYNEKIVLTPKELENNGSFRKFCHNLNKEVDFVHS